MKMQKNKELREKKRVCIALCRFFNFLFAARKINLNRNVCKQNRTRAGEERIFHHPTEFFPPYFSIIHRRRIISVQMHIFLHCRQIRHPFSILLFLFGCAPLNYNDSTELRLGSLAKKEPFLMRISPYFSMKNLKNFSRRFMLNCSKKFVQKKKVGKCMSHPHPGPKIPPPPPRPTTCCSRGETYLARIGGVGGRV